jgi:hypothetical protein
MSVETLITVFMLTSEINSPPAEVHLYRSSDCNNSV